MTLSAIKAIMVRYPPLVNFLGECDVPFKLPSDTRLLRKHRRTHYIHQRDIYSQIETAFEE